MCPPAGPATDPAFDNRLLAPAIERYDRARTALAAAEDGAAGRRATGALTTAEREIRTLLASRMRPTWDAVWQRPGPAAGAAGGRTRRGPLDPRPLVVHRPPRPGAGRASRRSPAATTR